MHAAEFSGHRNGTAERHCAVDDLIGEAARSAGVAPAYYVVAAAIVSLSTILTIRETAGRSLPQGVADEMFQSNADVRGAATPG